MEINIGDRVRYLNDVGGGKVIRILPNKTVIVLDETGFEIPISSSEIVVIESTRKNVQITATPVELEQKNQQVRQESNIYPRGTLKQGNNSPKAYFAFVPKTQNVLDCNEFDAYIINDCNHTIFFNLIENNSLISNGLKADIIAANKIKKITTFTRKGLETFVSFTLQVIFYTRGKCSIIKPWNCVLEIDPSIFERETAFKNTNYFEQKAFIYRLSDKNMENENFEKAVEQLTKENQTQLNSKILLDTSPKKSETKTLKNETLREVDLHIQILLENTNGLTPKEILETQMSHFRTEIESAIKDQIKRIVFIHGLGNGTLKNEIRRTLDREYKKYSYHDASFKEYGFGATMVIINK